MLELKLVDRMPLVDQCRIVEAEPHLTLALMLEGGGYHWMSDAMRRCDYQPNSCYLSCAWERSLGEDFFPANCRQRIVLIRYRLDRLRYFEQVHPSIIDGGELYSHSQSKARIYQFPMSDAARQIASDYLANGMPCGHVAQLRAEGRALDLLSWSASWVLNDVANLDVSNNDSAAVMSGRERRLLMRARDHIRTHCYELVSVADVAHSVGLNERVLKRGFPLLFGTSVYAFVLTCRVRAAAGLLRTTDLSIKEIAWRGGFAHTSHFARLFRRYYGISPRHYRRQ